MRNLSNDLNHFCLNFLHLFDDLLNDQFISDYFNLFDLSDYISHLLDDLHLFYNFLDSFSDLNNWNDLLNYPVNNLISHLHMIVSFCCSYIFNLWYYLLNNFFNLNDLRYLNYFLNDSLDKNRHFNDLLNNFLNWDYLFFENFNLLNFSLNMIDHSLHLDGYFFFYELIPKHLDFLNFCYLLLKLNYLLNYCWDFNNSFNYFLIRN